MTHATDGAGGAGDEDPHRQILGTILREQLAHPGRRGLAGLEDLVVVERLAATCRRRGW